MRRTIQTIPGAIILLLLTANVSIAQIGGYGTYKFLGYSNSARIAALGGNFLAVRDHDITLTQANPSLISEEMNNHLALSYVNSPGGINYGFVAYSRTFSKVGSFVGNFQFINYGKFTGADAAGNKTGDFSAGEYALNVGWGRKLSPVFFIGANGKMIYSQLESYHSFGIAVDVAGTYCSKDEAFTASIIGRNIGTQLSPYLPGQYEALPFELQIGLSEKFKHVPLRFSQLFTNLQRWNLTYTDPNNPSNQPDPITGETKAKSGVEKIADEMMRHIVLGAELTIAKVLALRIGYNYQRRQEMKLYDQAGMAGFSFGAGLRVKMFNISYTRATFQSGSPNPNYITVSINLNEFAKKQ
ncbi:MAG: type IX secretion system protein PorQ [Bacteroidota bacterium]